MERTVDCSGVAALLDAVEKILPIGANMWEAVAAIYNRATGQERDPDSLRKKFSELVNKPKPTGDPTLPPHNERAKRLYAQTQQNHYVGNSATYRAAPSDDDEINDDVFLTQQPAAAAAAASTASSTSSATAATEQPKRTQRRSPKTSLELILAQLAANSAARLAQPPPPPPPPPNDNSAMLAMMMTMLQNQQKLIDQLMNKQ